MERTVCVYCGSRSGVQPQYAAAARELGQALGVHDLQLVYGGGNVGLMGVLADAALASGAHVCGVIPRRLEQRELGHRGIHELVVVDDMHQRKAAMAARAAAFVALPGGFGTLEELFEMVAWRQLGFHAKPVTALNTLGYFDPLLTFLDQATREGFLDPAHRPLLRTADSVEALLSMVLNELESPPNAP